MVETDVNGWRCSQGLRDVVTSSEVPSMDVVQQTIPNSLTQSSVADIDSGSLNSSKDSAASTPDELYIPDAVTEEHCKEEVIKAADDDDGSDDSSITAAEPAAKKKTRGRVKIGFKLIEQKQRRCATFHKRRKGLMKKGFEISTLTGAEVMVLAAWGDKLFSYSTKKMQKVVGARTFQDLVLDSLRSADEDEDDQEQDDDMGSESNDGFTPRKCSDGQFEHNLSWRKPAKRVKYEQNVTRFAFNKPTTSTASNNYATDVSPLSPLSPRHKPLMGYNGKDSHGAHMVSSLPPRISWPIVSSAPGHPHPGNMGHVIQAPLTQHQQSQQAQQQQQQQQQQASTMMTHLGSPPSSAAMAAYQSLHQQRMNAGDVGLAQVAQHGESGLSMYHTGSQMYLPGQQVHSGQMNPAAYIGPMQGMPMYRPYPDKAPGSLVIAQMSRQGRGM